MNARAMFNGILADHAAAQLAVAVPAEPITPASTAHATELAKAIRLSNRAHEWAQALRDSNGKFSRAEREALLALCDAITTALDDVGETAQVCREELGLDEDGLPLSEREGPSFGFRHPDHPSFGGRA